MALEPELDALLQYILLICRDINDHAPTKLEVMRVLYVSIAPKTEYLSDAEVSVLVLLVFYFSLLSSTPELTCLDAPLLK